MTKGAILLTLREGAGVLIGLIGVVALTRLIGPAHYGLYAAAATVFAYLMILAQWGLPVFLVRREGELPDRVIHQALVLAGLLGIADAIEARGTRYLFVAPEHTEDWIRSLLNQCATEKDVLRERVRGLYVVKRN